MHCQEFKNGYGRILRIYLFFFYILILTFAPSRFGNCDYRRPEGVSFGCGQKGSHVTVHRVSKLNRCQKENNWVLKRSLNTSGGICLPTVTVYLLEEGKQPRNDSSSEKYYK